MCCLKLFFTFYRSVLYSMHVLIQGYFTLTRGTVCVAKSGMAVLWCPSLQDEHYTVSHTSLYRCKLWRFWAKILGSSSLRFFNRRRALEWQHTKLFTMCKSTVHCNESVVLHSKTGLGINWYLDAGTLVLRFLVMIMCNILLWSGKYNEAGIYWNQQQEVPKQPLEHSWGQSNEKGRVCGIFEEMPSINQYSNAHCFSLRFLAIKSCLLGKC